MAQEAKQATKKEPRDVSIALKHLNKRRDMLLDKRAALNKEIEKLDKMILAGE